METLSLKDSSRGLKILFQKRRGEALPCSRRAAGGAPEHWDRWVSRAQIDYIQKGQE